MSNRPSFGRSREERGLDQFDTPPIALEPLFVHEPLLTGVTAVAEPFCGAGNLVIAMRARGLIVHASDVQHRGCPDSTVLDFQDMTTRPPGCDVLISNPPFARAMEFIERALNVLKFRVVVLLLKQSFLATADRLERLHKPGHLRRVHFLAERLQGMHDTAYLAAGGKTAGQSQVHAWFVFDRNHCGPAMISPVSINRPNERMPWTQIRDNGAGYHDAPAAAAAAPAPDNGRTGNGYHGPRGTSLRYVRARLARDGRADLVAQLETGMLSVREALRLLQRSSTSSRP